MRVVPVVKEPLRRKKVKKPEHVTLGIQLPGDTPSKGHRKANGGKTLS